jgi:hypothetical protein
VKTGGIGHAGSVVSDFEHDVSRITAKIDTDDGRLGGSTALLIAS